MEILLGILGSLDEAPWSYLVLALVGIVAVTVGIAIGDVLRKLLFHEQK